MTLFLQNDAGGSGSGGVFADRGFTDLVQIANFDTGIGQDSPVGDLIRITYAQTLTGVPPDRLDTLVTTDFTDVPGATDIIVIPVDQTFQRPNGHFVTENAGLTFPVGHAENPTSSVLVVYDTSDNGGSGYCLPKEGGGTTGFPSPVILYHELSHALRFATNALLDNSDTGCAANDEEHQAEVDENDMRDQLGIDHRDDTQHCATSGCTSNCCIVASVATGSPYSADVNALRAVRDGSLRWSEVGFDFFEHLHYDYYAFSPQVVRMMAGAPELREQVSAAFVVPLTRCLLLARHWAEDRPDAVQLGERFCRDAAATPELGSLQRSYLDTALTALGGGPVPTAAEPAGLTELAELLHRKAAGSAFIRWALLDPVKTYLTALRWRLDGEPAAQIGRRLAERIERWVATLPLTEVWRRLPGYTLGEELAFLRAHLLTTPDSRAAFGSRLLDHLADRQGIDELLATNGYVIDRRPA